MGVNFIVPVVLVWEADSPVVLYCEWEDDLFYYSVSDETLLTTFLFCYLEGYFYTVSGEALLTGL